MIYQLWVRLGLDGVMNRKVVGLFNDPLLDDQNMTPGYDPHPGTKSLGLPRGLCLALVSEPKRFSLVKRDCFRRRVTEPTGSVAVYGQGNTS